MAQAISGLWAVSVERGEVGSRAAINATNLPDPRRMDSLF